MHLPPNASDHNDNDTKFIFFYYGTNKETKLVNQITLLHKIKMVTRMSLKEIMQTMISVNGYFLEKMKMPFVWHIIFKPSMDFLFFLT